MLLIPPSLDLILSRLLRFLTRPSDGAPQVSVTCCCEDTGSSLRLREPLAALLRLARALVGEQIAPLLLDLLAQLCDAPTTLLPMLPPTALPALAPVFSARLSSPYSLPPCEAVPECEVYKIPASLMMDLVAPLYLMFIVRPRSLMSFFFFQHNWGSIRPY